MAKYTLQNVTTVTNEETGAVEHTADIKVRGLDSADVTDMQAPLIAVQQAWNSHGIEGQGKAATQSAQS